MLKVDLIGFLENSSTRQEIDNGRGWVEWCTRDLDYNGVNPEWFSVAACNDYYFERIPVDANHEPYLVQAAFEQEKLLEYAEHIYDQLEFKDWDDFYKKMSEHFIYED